MTVQCCKCKKVRSSREWIRSEAPLPERVSHTYCPDCLSETLQEFRREAGGERIVFAAPAS